MSFLSIARAMKEPMIVAQDDCATLSVNHDRFALKFERHVDADDQLSVRVYRAYEDSEERLFRFDLIETDDLAIARRLLGLVGQVITVRVERYHPNGDVKAYHEHAYRVRAAAPMSIATKNISGISGWAVMLE